jgi:hypothetical protein
MLNKEQIELLKKFGFNYDSLVEAIKSEDEKEIKLPEGEFFTQATLEARDSNKISEGKKLGIEEGKKAGIEISNKEIIKKFGIQETEGKKDMEPSKLIEIAYDKAQKGDDGLKGQIKALISDKQKLEETLSNKYKEVESVKFETSLFGMLPKNRFDVLSDSEQIQIIKGLIVDVDGKKAISFNGEVLRDEQTRDLMPIDKALAKVYESKKWIQAENTGGGRGGSDNPTGGSGKITKYSEAEKSWRDQGKEISDPGFQTYVVGLAADKDFNMDA